MVKLFPPKIDIRFSFTYKKLYWKGEPYRFNGFTTIFDRDRLPLHITVYNFLSIAMYLC